MFPVCVEASTRRMCTIRCHVSRWQVGEVSSESSTITPASEVTAGAFVEEYEAEGKVAGAGEVVEEVRFLVSADLKSCVVLYFLSVVKHFTFTWPALFTLCVISVSGFNSSLRISWVRVSFQQLENERKSWMQFIKNNVFASLPLPENITVFTTRSVIVYLSLGRYEYSQSFRDSQSSDGSAQAPSEFGSNMVYYYDDGNKVQMYTVDEKLLKEYIKRQMWVSDIH